MLEHLRGEWKVAHDVLHLEATSARTGGADGGFERNIRTHSLGKCSAMSTAPLSGGFWLKEIPQFAVWVLEYSDSAVYLPLRLTHEEIVLC
jgi:hypothetical protein